MPRSIAHPDFVYKPWSEERRKRAQEAAAQRLGAKPGHRIVYGVQVPREHWPSISKLATAARHADGLPMKKVQALIRRLVRLAENAE